MAKIYLKFNAAVIRELKVAKDEISFGRKPGNDIVIDHPTISGFHGKIKKQGDEWTVEDLNSTNGTFLNGRRIKSSALKNRDQIGAAGHILEFYLDGTTLAVEVEPVEPKSPEPGTSGPAAPPDIEKQKELLRRSLMNEPTPAAAAGPSPAAEPAPSASSRPAPNGAKTDPGTVRIVSGGVDGQTEVVLKDLVTYIGTSDQALIKIKGFLAPSLAAAISHRPEGYFLKAVKAGYPKVNGNAIKEQVFLENGALIEVGGTNMVFYHAASKTPEPPATAPVKPSQPT